MPTQSTLNISPSVSNDSSFAPIVSDTFIGPEPLPLPEETAVTVAPEPTQSIANWTVMNTFDDGLRKALISFIDTTKDGKTLAPTTNGRTKKLDFYFQGVPSTDLKPGEAGVFSIVFSYPPGANTTSVNTAAGTPLTNTTIVSPTITAEGGSSTVSNLG